MSHVQKKRFNSLSHIEKEGSMLWVISNYSSQIEEIIIGSKSYLKSSIFWVIFFKMFNSWRSYFWEEGSSLWVILKKVQFFVIKCQKIKFIETFKKDGSILRVIFSKRRQFFESNWKEVQFFESHRKEKGSILWVLFSFKNFQFFESYFPKKNDQFNWVIHFVK